MHQLFGEKANSDPGKEMYKSNLGHLDKPESKEIMKDTVKTFPNHIVR